jgi:hypothetical protein
METCSQASLQHRCSRSHLLDEFLFCLCNVSLGCTRCHSIIGVNVFFLYHLVERKLGWEKNLSSLPPTFYT